MTSSSEQNMLEVVLFHSSPRHLRWWHLKFERCMSLHLLTIPKNNMTNNNCCPFEASSGYTTEDGRLQWLQEHNYDEESAEKISKSLQANLDATKPLYYWQLYSLIGTEPIVSIVQDFYERVYADTEESWFRDAFASISGIHHHVQTQALYWIDAFGGGRAYHGGNYRLNFHHEYNAAKVMNAKGATRWMHHMRGALENYQDKFDDPRVMPCIVDFLKTKMKVYAKEHNWEFDESDFNFAKNMTKQVNEGDSVLSTQKDEVENHAKADDNARQ